MEYALTRADSRRADSYAIDDLGLPGMVLMENAGRAVRNAVLEILAERGGLTVYVLAGKGNNGGDGFVVARYLLEEGVDVRVFHTAAAEEYTGDAATNLHLLGELTDTLYFTPDPATLGEYEQEMLAADVLVDALLGTGITGAPRAPYDGFIEYLNSYNAPTVSVDIPSGMDADSGQTPGAVVGAEYTVTMGYLKTGLLFSPGRERAGEIRVAEIGIPGRALEYVDRVYHLPNFDDIYYRLPYRSADIYKHRAGKVFTLAGAPGYTGAATLVGDGALGIGAGLVMAGIPKSLNPVLETKLTEVITVPLPETADGTFSPAGIDSTEPHLQWSDTLAIGPGMTRHRETGEFIRKILERYDKVAVVDADATTYFSGENLELLQEMPGELILTPHWGEFSRMTGMDTEELTANRLTIVEEFADQYNVTLILKGAPTIIGTREGHVFINPTGNAGMATGGSGDVLTGMLAGLAAQGLTPADTALVGCYIHGLAGDMARDNRTEMGVTAGSLLAHLPEALQYLHGYNDHY